MTEHQWTKAEITEFDKLVDSVSSRDQLTRINARIDMDAFIAKHGKGKCDAMFAHLEAGGEYQDGPITS